MNVYFDNAATSPMYQSVVDEMMPYFSTFFGNPSSTHKKGREVKAKIEQARKKIATLLNAHTSEIFFTSCATESNNIALKSFVKTHQLKTVISSKLEHHAVLHTLEILEKKGEINVLYVNHDSKGVLDLMHLEDLLIENSNVLVSIMHGNNEIGNLNPIQEIAILCKRYNSFFHSDTVQTIGHYHLDVKQLDIDVLVASAHKFHGPKGIGFMYLKGGIHLDSFLHGGAQERGFRAGTENVAGIIGLTKALEETYNTLTQDKLHILALKKYLIFHLKEQISDISFNGNCENEDQSLYSIVNISLPPLKNNNMLLFNLDLHNIFISGGSACASGALAGSHVLHALDAEDTRSSIRCSFSKFNTFQEIDYFIEKLKTLYP